MKFKISQTDFTKILIASSKSLSSRTNLPVLSNVLVSTSKNKLELLSTDLETATKATVSCQTEIEGKTTIPGRMLMEFIAALPEGEVILEKLGEEVLVSTKGYSARFATIAPEEFPAIPKIEKGQEVKVEVGDFVRGVFRVAFSAAADEGRPILTGTLCEFGKNKLSVVATDGYRLSYQEIPTQKEGADLKVIIPAKAIVEVAKLAESIENKEGENITIVIADSLNQINFKVNGIEFTSRLIEGEFPNWQKIIPATFSTKVKISKDEFIKLIRVASIFAREGGNIVRLRFEKPLQGNGAKEGTKQGRLTVLASGSQVGSNEAFCEVEMSGSGGEIAFNFRYLLEALSTFEEEDVFFEMIESLNPGKLTGAGKGDDFFHIIMPVRLQS